MAGETTQRDAPNGPRWRNHRSDREVRPRQDSRRGRREHTMTLIIGFGNKARHGKDGAALAIVDYYNDRNLLVRNCMGYQTKCVNVVRIGFADALYEIARNEYGMTEKDPALLQ